MRVLLVMKGPLNLEEVTVFHYRLVVPGDFPNGPQLIRFEPNVAGLGGRKEYLVFLVREKDGTFEPTSGQFDPVYSVGRTAQ